MSDPSSPDNHAVENSGTPSATSNDENKNRISSTDHLGDAPVHAKLDEGTRTVPPSHSDEDPSGEKSLPWGWKTSVSEESGKRYYIDHNTRTTTWNHPSHKTKSTDSASTKSADDPSSDDGLPLGWELRENPNGRNYYVDHITRTTSWVRPLKNLHETTRPLPVGWERRRTETGRLYFVDHNTRMTTWVPPWDAEGDEAASEVSATQCRQVISREDNVPEKDRKSIEGMSTKRLEDDSNWVFVSKS